jgi:hypothetical protein
MKGRRIPVLSYLAALFIGAMLFAVVWRWSYRSASSTVVLSGIAGVVIAVSLFWLLNEFNKPKDDGD